MFNCEKCYNFYMFQKIKDFFSKNSNTNSVKSLKELMNNVGYNKEIIYGLDQGNFEENLIQKVTSSPLKENRRLLIEQNDKEAWRAFQVANAQKIHHICFINFFPKNLKGLVLKTHKNKNSILYLKSFEEAKLLSECVFVSFGSFPISNTATVGDISSDKKYYFLFNSSLSEIPKIEKVLTSDNVIGFSASQSIFDGSRFGFRKIFSTRKYKNNKFHSKFDEVQIKFAISSGKLNFLHIQSLFESFDNNKLLSAIKLIPGLSTQANVDQFTTISKSMKAIICSMTPKEKKNPLLLNISSRVERIAKGSGQPLEKTRRFINQILSLIQLLKDPQIRRKFFETSDLTSIINNPLLWKGLK